MMKIGRGMRVLGVERPAEWAAVLRNAPQYDFYHLPGYHALAESRGDGAARLFVHEEGEYTIALPLLLRPLNKEAGLNAEGLQDATSAYGYAGPVFSHPEMPEPVLRNFREALDAELAEMGVIAVFSRLHPLISQRGILAGLGECVAGGETVSIDLTLPDDRQRMQFRSDHRRGIHRALRAGMAAVEDAQLRFLGDFIDVYTETMRRVNAADYYFFDRAYFDELISREDSRIHLFVALSAGGEVAAGALMLSCNGILQYHLGGTRGEYMGLAPMKLLFDTARLWAMERDFKVFHLGGGVGSQADSLFHFKAGFSDRRHPFFTWRWALDPAACERLALEKERWNVGRGLRPGAPGFFPSYRAPGVPIA
jgi:CelD/BcsL family acetyltransferase involved in cellulose biosynthesis